MRIGLRPSLLGVLCLSPLLGACELTTAPSTDREIGIVEWQPAALAAAAGSDHVVIAAPDTVEAGVAFTATITTLGLDACWKEAGAETELSAALATITPYDSNPEDEGVMCAEVITPLSRDVELRFTRRGSATIRVTGRKVVGADLASASKVTVEKTVFVR